MRLRLGSAEHDLTTRTLAIGLLQPRRASILDGDGAPPLDALLLRADQLVGEGAEVLDVGGVRAGAEIGEEEELERVVPVVRALRARFDVPLSIDTSRPAVVTAACAAGALLVGGAGIGDEAYLRSASMAGAAVVVTDRRLQVGSPPDLVEDVRSYLAEGVARAYGAGLADERIVVDPGLDLGKSPAQSLTVLRGSAALADLGPPLLLDASNRRFLGMLLGLEPEERRMASHAAAALGIARGCRIVRAHDVRGARRTVDVLEALLTARLVQVAAALPGDGDG